MNPVRVTARDGGALCSVRVQPRSSRSGLDGLHGDALRFRVHAPPVKGAANEAVVAVPADALGVPKGSVRIVSGETSRSKVVEVRGVAAEAVLALGG